MLKADPKNAFALVTLASETARHTRENDLDKDEQLAKVDKWAKDAIEAAKVMPKIRTDLPDADWEAFKKDMQAQADEALGMANMVRKNYDAAATNFKDALTTSAAPNPATMVRLAQVYINTGKYDNATFTLDKAINTPNIPPQVKTIAETMKSDIAKRHPAAPAAGAPAAPAAGAPATPPAANKP